MASLRMKGPYLMDIETIEAKVTSKTPGNFALGREDEEGRFIVWRVGRSDSNLRAGLKALVGKTKNRLFKFSCTQSAKAAFQKECENFHDFNPPGNEKHPDRPAGTNWHCPRCDVFRVTDHPS